MPRRRSDATVRGERGAGSVLTDVVNHILAAVRALLAALRVVAGFLLVASVALNFINVIARYFFNASIFWAEEVMLFFMVGCVFLGSGVVAWSGRQIKMDVIVGMMPPKVREVLDVFSELVFIAVAISIVVFAWPVIRDLYNFDQRSQSAEVPLVHSPVAHSDWSCHHGGAGERAPDRGHLSRSARAESLTMMAAALAYFVVPAALLVLGLPIFLVLLVTCLVVVLLVADIPTDAIQTYLFSGLDNFPLLAVPFFVLAGEIMAQGGIARRVVVWVMCLIGGVRGSLAVTTVAASELFGAMAHTAVGTVVAVGRMIYPSLKDGGYSERFAVGLIASSGAIAVVIPPSIAMILYSVSAQQSAVALFTAGILPSLLIGFVDALFVMLYARIKMVPLTDPARWRAIWASTKEASWSIGTVVVIFGGIYGGVFTPTEAAGVAVIYSLFVTMAVHREIGPKELWNIIQSSVFLISQILLIVTAAGLYSWLLTTSGIPQKIIGEIHALNMPPWALLLSLNVVLLIMGSFLEPPAAILILTPLLLPLVQSVGVDPVHFGIIMAVNLSIGMYAPPFGLNLFASQAVFHIPLGTIYRGVLPFLAINFATLLVITYVPAISMVLLGK